MRGLVSESDYVVKSEMFEATGGDLRDAIALIEGEMNLVANLANLSAHFYQMSPSF